MKKQSLEYDHAYDYDPFSLEVKGVQVPIMSV